MISLDNEIMGDHSKGDATGLDLNSVSDNYGEGIGLDNDGDDRLHSVCDYNDCKGGMKQCNDFCSSPSHVKEENFTSEMETLNLASLPEIPSTKDVSQREGQENASEDGKLDSEAHDIEEKDICSNEERHVNDMPPYELEEITKAAPGNAFSSSMLDHVDMETTMDLHHSVQDSPNGSPKQSTSPFSSQKIPVDVNLGSHDPSYSPNSIKTKKISLTERFNLDKGVNSHDQSLLSVVQTSISGQGSPKRSNPDGDSFPKSAEKRKRSRNDYSIPKHPRKERSVSRSPPKRRDSLQSPLIRRESRSRIGQKDSRSPVRRSGMHSPIRRWEQRESHAPQDSSSSRVKRDYRNRSRSRSPYKRDRHREAAAGPGRRFPPINYHGSPRKRAWSPPSNRITGLGKAGKNLFVAGFSFMTREKDLERKFCKFGHVINVRIVRDRRYGDSRGFGFISMEKDEEADAAIKGLDETEWNGRIILVEKSKTSDRH